MLGETLRLYTKLSDKFVGNLVILQSSSAYDVLEDLCRQASQSMPHESMPHESLGVRNVVLYTNNIMLTPLGFEFKKSFSPSEAKCAEAALDEARRVGRVDMMWDDGYEHACKVVADCDIVVHVDYQSQKSVFTVRLGEQNAVIPPEVLACYRRTKATAISFKVLPGPNGHRTHVVRDLQFLEFAPCTDVSLYGIHTLYWPSTLLNLVNLSFDGLLGHIPPGIGKLANLRGVYILNVLVLPDDFCDLRLHVGAFWYCSDHDVVSKLTSMPTLEHLKLYHSQGPERTIPTTLGLLTTLKILHMGSVDFSGVIPTELGALCNLSSLKIYAGPAKFDFTIPHEVAALQIHDFAVLPVDKDRIL